MKIWTKVETEIQSSICRSVNMWIMKSIFLIVFFSLLNSRAMSFTCGLRNSTLGKMLNSFANQAIESCFPECQLDPQAQQKEALKQFLTAASVIENPKKPGSAQKGDFKKWEKFIFTQRQSLKDSELQCHIEARDAGKQTSLKCLNKDIDKRRRVDIAHDLYKKYLETNFLVELQTQFQSAGYSAQMFCLIHRYSAFQEVFQISDQTTMLEGNKMAAVKELLLKKISGESKPGEPLDLEGLCKDFRGGKPMPIFAGELIARSCF